MPKTISRGAVHEQFWRAMPKRSGTHVDIGFKIEWTDSPLLLKFMNLAVGQLEVVDSFVYALEFVHGV